MTEERTRPRVQHPGGGTVLTKQADKELVDINRIMKAWLTKGTPPPVNGQEPVYGDFTGIQDFHHAANRVLEAQEAFDDLPAAVRKVCQNDPGKFLDLVADPDRRDELVELGLIEQRMPPAVREEVEAAKEPPAPLPGDPPAPAGPAPTG